MGKVIDWIVRGYLSLLLLDQPHGLDKSDGAAARRGKNQGFLALEKLFLFKMRSTYDST
jgi:hypothetical protein